MPALFNLFVVCVFFTTVFGFLPSTVKHAPKSMIVMENFDLNFKSPKIITSKEIFTEKQLREYTSTYSEDIRINPLEALLSIFSKKEAPTASSPALAQSNLASALKPTVSLAVLEEKTAAYVTGKIDAKAFYTVLKAAFGTKLESVLPEIVLNLPEKKGSELSKAAK